MATPSLWRVLAIALAATACVSAAPSASAAEFGSGEVAAACGEPSDAPYPASVLGDDPLGYWRLCQWGVSSTPNYADESGNGRTLLGSPNATSTSPTAKSPGGPLTNETNAFQDFSASYIGTPSTTGIYAPLTKTTVRGAFSVEAWVKPKTAYTACPTCGFVIPVARSAGSWQLGWAGTAPARGREPSWVHGGLPGPPIGANGWTFTIYAGYDCHGTSPCNPDNTHYVTAHRLQTTAPVEADSWYHLVATYDGLTMRLYVNGALAGELNVGAVDDVLTPNNGQFRLGYASDEENAANTGFISACGCAMLRGSEDEAAYYGYALTAEQIAGRFEAATHNPLSEQAGPDSAYRRGVATDAPYLWFPLDEHYVESTSRATCYPCPSYERTTGLNAGQVFAPMRDITGPSFPLTKDDRGLEFSDGARISTNQGPKYPLPSTTTNMSVETWIQTAPSTPEKQAFFSTPTCSGCSGTVALRLNAGALEIRADTDGFPFNTWQSLAGQGLDDDKWHHVLVVRDLTGAAKWRAYVDGQPTGVTRPTSTQSLLRGKYLGLGDMNASADITGNGRIALDEFAYYTRALDGSRVDYAAALRRHAPVLLYDSGEKFHVVSPGALTDFYVEGGIFDWSNSLKDASGVFAMANPSFGDSQAWDLDLLQLSYLAAGYTSGESPPSRRAGTPASEDDFVSARGNDDDGYYEDDSHEMELRDGYPYKIYGRIASTSDGEVWLQYWFFYYFNPDPFGLFGPVHEGDWEMAQVGLGGDLAPDRVAFAQHTSGQRCDWSLIDHVGDQPVVYVAEHSHASYFSDPAGYDHADGLGGGLLTPNVEEITGGSPPWVNWPGHWGDSSASPHGPKFQGDKWSDPTSWAAGLPSC
jgi:Concanavalin A-like lectin/glucanases superfamily